MAHFETLAIHAGQEPDRETGAVNVPVYLTSTFAQDAVGEHRGWEYARTGNPTRAALEACLGELEGGTALCFASGMAAEATLAYTFAPGDRVLLGDDVYGGTYRLFARVLGPWGIVTHPLDLTNLDALRTALAADSAGCVWIETPTNPWLRVVDIAAVCDLAHEAGARVVVDNTFATPYLQRPLDLGADVVVHSTTKYLGGHSDVVGGALVVRDRALGERLAFLQNAAGAVPGPLDCFLTLRGVKTLAVRMDRHSENAAAVAAFLDRHEAVAEVLYPGLPAHPQADLSARQMRAPGGMVSFRHAGGGEPASKMAARTRLFTLAESLGGVESLIEVPAVMTHASVAGTALEVPADLVRLSVGLEHVDDLLADLDQALAG